MPQRCHKLKENYIEIANYSASALVNSKTNILNKILAQFSRILKEYSTIKWDLFWDITFFISVNCSKENKHTIILIAAEETFEKKINIYYLKGFF